MKVTLSNGDTISGSMRVLNYISLYMTKASQQYESENMLACAEIASTDAHLIYLALYEKGYYNRFK